MSLAQEIDKLEKEVDAAIKAAEAAKPLIAKELVFAKHSEDIFSRTIMQVTVDLQDSLKRAEGFESSYQDWIADLNMYLKDYPECKKKAVECDKLYKQMLDKKKEMDATRKKAGGTYKPTKEDQKFDAAFKKVSEDHDWDTMSDRIEETLKGIEKETQVWAERAEEVAKQVKEKKDEFDKIWKKIIAFKFPAGPSYPRRDYVLGKYFEEYFKSFAKSGGSS
jgi:hypothetical protein